MARYRCPVCGESRSETPFCQQHGAMECLEDQELAALREDLGVSNAQLELSHIANAALRARAEKAEGLLDSRAGKLLRKGKPFIVVANDEPYFTAVYATIRTHEKLTGRWNDEDERCFAELCPGYNQDYPPRTPELQAAMMEMEEYLREKQAHAATRRQLARARALLEKYKPDTIPCHQNTNGEWVPDAEHPIDAFLREIAAPPAPVWVIETHARQCGKTRQEGEGLVYLASPYSDPDPLVQAERHEAVCYAAAALMRQRIMVFSPIAHTHPIACCGGLPTGWEWWKKYDRLYLDACSRMIVLQLLGWEESKGVQDEIRIMQAMGKPIEYLTLGAVLNGASALSKGPTA